MLRAKLSSIIENSMFHASLASRIEQLRGAPGHTIQLLSSESDDLRYNCVAYALGLHEQLEYKKLARQWSREDAPVGTEFIQHMIDCKAIVEENDSAVGLLGVYF